MTTHDDRCVDVLNTCHCCTGSGVVEDFDGDVPCSRCGGLGHLHESADRDADNVPSDAWGLLAAQRALDNEPCPKCGGDRLRADFVDPTRCHVPRAETSDEEDQPLAPGLVALVQRNKPAPSDEPWRAFYEPIRAEWRRIAALDLHDSPEGHCETFARACVAVEDQHTAALLPGLTAWRDRAEKAEAAIARVEALHVPCSQHPTCADSDNFCHECGHDWPCSTVDALRGPEPTEEAPPTYATGHGFTPGRFTPDRCTVQLSRYPCPYGREQHDPTKPPEDVDAFGRLRPTEDGAYCGKGPCSDLAGHEGPCVM